MMDHTPGQRQFVDADKLKVYYGPTQDSKVTYEAKVCLRCPVESS